MRASPMEILMRLVRIVALSLLLALAATNVAKAIPPWIDPSGVQRSVR
jgi:hypothetical protein